MNYQNFIKLTFTVLLAIFIVGCQSNSENSSEDSESSSDYKDEINVALPTQPPTMDPHTTTAQETYVTARHIFESLLELDSEYEPQLMLAESIDESDDGKKYIFNLREGIMFHNGEEMTADDVVASMDKWKKLSSAASGVFPEGEFSAKDDYTVELKLDEPSSETLYAIASAKQPASIMPESVIEAAGDDDLEEFIGTGPFVFEEWKKDEHLHLKKYDDYQPVDEPADGLSGKKEAFTEDLYFDFVDNPSTRVSSIQSGQYDIVQDIPTTSYKQLEDDENVNVFVIPYGNVELFYNKKEGISSDPKMRQAINAALNQEAIMEAAFSEEDLYNLNSSYFPEDQKDWYSDAGEEYYNQNDPEKAEKLASEAGYDGETVTLLTTRDYEYQYKVAVVIEQQLNDAGINAELDVYDWATLTDRRQDPDKWDLFITGVSTVPSPSLILTLDSEYPGWTDDEKISEGLNNIKKSTSKEDSKEDWEKIQKYIWEEYLPITKIGEHPGVSATTDQVEDYSSFKGPILWNTKVKK